MTQNPLTPVALFFCLLWGVGHVMFSLLLIEGNSLTEIVTTRSHGILSLCLCISVVVCYFLENILAWWIALLYLPVMFVARVERGREFSTEGVIVYVAICGLVSCYLLSKYAAYKKYINRNGSLEIPRTTGDLLLPVLRYDKFRNNKMAYLKAFLRATASGHVFLYIAAMAWCFLAVRSVIYGSPASITVLDPNEIAPSEFEWFTSYMTPDEFEKFYSVRSVAMQIGASSALIGIILHSIWQKLHGKDIYSWD